MNKTIAAFLLLSCGTTHALDLTPKEGFKELEGIKIPVLLFTDKGQTVSWIPPWPVTGEGNRITLRPTNAVHSAMFIEVRKRASSAVPAPGATQTDLITWALPFLPQDLEKLVFSSMIPCPYQLHSKPSQEYIFNYVSQARAMTSSLSYVDLNDEERVFVHITSLAEAFKSFRSQAIPSMFRWEWQD
ncbi:MAG: hypothetical protein V4710_15735 [Verrucomicrobiota bacterium]